MNILVIVHIIAAILFLGPVAVASSLYPAFALQATGGDQSSLGSARILHRITNTYALLSLLVPLAGLGMFIFNSAYMKQGKFHAAILISVIAWAVLFFLVLPRQKALLALATDPAAHAAEPDKAPALKKQLAMFSGIFNALWIIAAVLMFI